MKVAEPSRIIDAHQHVFWHGRDDAALLADLDARGIAKAVLLNWEVTALEHAEAYEGAFNPIHAEPRRRHPGLPFADVVRAVRRWPERFLAGYCPHPLDARAVEHLDAALRMFDVRICGEWKATVPLDDPRCLNLFGYCGQKHLPVLFHIDVPYRPDPQTGQAGYCPEWYGGTADNVRRAVGACPQTTFIAHGPGFWRYVSGDADGAPEVYPAGAVAPGGRVSDLLEELPNLHADLSGFSGRNALARDVEHGKRFLLKHHDRLLFGRDECSGDLGELLRSLDLPAEAVENITHRNAERLLPGDI